MGNITYCRKCQQFGELQYQLCAYCGVPVCSKCVTTAPCVEKHAWCGNCTYQAWTAQIPTVDIGKPYRVETAPNSYVYYRNAKISWVSITRCEKDNPETVTANLVYFTNLPMIFSSAQKERFPLVPQFTISPSETEMIKVNGSQTILHTIKAAQALGLDGSRVQETIISVIIPHLNFTQFLEELLSNINRDPHIVSQILASRSFAVIDYFIRICDAVHDTMLDERLANFRAIPVEIAKSDPNLAVIWVWAHSRCMKDPHEGKKALSSLSINSPFFKGFESSLDGLVNYNAENCLNGLKLIRNDPSINHKLVDFVVKRIELEAKRLRDMAPADTGVRIEKLHLGDVIGGAKIGSQIDIKDSVINRSTIGGGNEEGTTQPKKFCPDCGCKLGSSGKFCPDCGSKLL